MRSMLPTTGEVASNSADQTGGISAQTGSEFFAKVCKEILGKDAGLHLHYATGVPERSCYRYASGEREVPVLVLRALLHSEQGAPFLQALMHGCTAPWWLAFERERKLAAAAERFIHEIAD